MYGAVLPTALHWMIDTKKAGRMMQSYTPLDLNHIARTAAMMNEIVHIAIATRTTESENG